MKHLLEQSQIYVAVGLFPVENDIFKSSSTSEKYSLECLLPSIIMLRLDNLTIV